MKIEIHRGIDQIGGCITEISTDTSRILIDLGKQLPGTNPKLITKDEEEFVKSIFDKNQKQNEAVFYTHAHSDHVGLFSHVPDSIPQYISDGGQEIMKTKAELIKKGHILNHRVSSTIIKQEINSESEHNIANDNFIISKIESFHTWERPKPHTCLSAFEIGDIRITPFFNCHSIYDSYMFLIEADGKRIWHTGDFREHGYIGKGLMPTILRYATDIDILITEGTMLGREEICMPEREVKRKMVCMMNAFKYVVVLASGTDIERCASIKEAANTAHKNLYVCSAFANRCMDIFTRREAKASNGLFEFNQKYVGFNDRKIPKMKKKGFVLIANPTHLAFAKELTEDLNQSEVLFIYSTWDGYYKDPIQIENNPLYKGFHEAFTNVVDIHTSGHADRQTLKKVIETINPKEAIVAIHKEENQSLESLVLNETLKNKILNLKTLEL